MITKDDVCRNLNSLAQTFNKKLSAHDIQLIFEIFNDKNWTLWEFETACHKCAVELEWFPKPVHILERWEIDPGKIVNPEFVQLPRTVEDDKEIEELIARRITNQHLKDVCGRIVFREPPHPYSQRIYCQTCEDKGLIEVYHPRTCQKAKARKLSIKDIRTVTVSCHCDRGPITSESSNRRPMMVFEKNRMPAVREIEPELQLAEVGEFYAAAPDHDFADWSPAPF